MLAAINLGSAEALQENYRAAVAYYDAAQAAQPPGRMLRSDVSFHALRARSFYEVGRTSEVMRDAEFALALLEMDTPATPVLPSEAARTTATASANLWVVYLIAPVLRAGDQAVLERAKQLVRAQQIDRTDVDAITLVSAVALELGDVELGLEMSLQAMRVAPGLPGLQNNHCYALVRAGRHAEGLPFCEQALAPDPNVPDFQHSYATALAGVGRCDEARTAMAQARALRLDSPTYRTDPVCQPASR